MCVLFSFSISTTKSLANYLQFYNERSFNHKRRVIFIYFPIPLSFLLSFETQKSFFSISSSSPHTKLYYLTGEEIRQHKGDLGDMSLVSLLSLVTGKAGPSGFGSASTAEQVTEGINATNITAIVTGGASGIGLETSRVLALRGAHVVIAARNLEAANEAKQVILKDHGAAKISVLKLDLCSIKSINAFVDNFKALDLPLNILINNAGVMFLPYQLSEDGIEMQFATNYLGHFHLTNLLLDKMKNTARITGVEGRIVNLTSIAHLLTYEKGIRFDNINDRTGYSDKVAYGQSKLANLLHANELSRRLKEEGANITVNSVHPGLIMTPLMRHASLLMKFAKLFTFYFWKNVPQGAATTCYVALHPKMNGVTGKYYLDCNEMEPSAYATNEVLAKNLWDFSNKLVDSIQSS